MKNWYAVRYGYYAVQHGGDYDCRGNGSFNKREAKEIAKKLHLDYPDEEIRICVYMGDVCTSEIVIYEGER